MDLFKDNLHHLKTPNFKYLWETKTIEIQTVVPRIQGLMQFFWEDFLEQVSLSGHTHSWFREAVFKLCLTENITLAKNNTG